jgi:hexosaminidase
MGSLSTGAKAPRRPRSDALMSARWACRIAFVVAGIVLVQSGRDARAAVDSASEFVDPGASRNLALLPQPSLVRREAGSFRLDARTLVVGGPGSTGTTARFAADLRRATGLPLAVRDANDTVAGPLPDRGLIRFVRDETTRGSLGHEGYRLTVTPREVRIVAAGEAGLFYGSVTLRQLFPAQASAPGSPAPGETPAVAGLEAPSVQIEDVPRFAWRGLLLDPARHFLPLEFLKRFVDLMALHKLNRLQLHLTDDQGWRFQVLRHPRLTEVGSVRGESPRRGDRDRGDGVPYGPFFYTQDELRALVRYAAERHVTIVPEIEMPGHMLAALATYPRLSCRGGPLVVRTRWGVEEDILCAGNDDAVNFAREVLEEVVAVFPGTYVHIGGDEAPRARWRECAKCQSRIRNEGLRNEAELQTWFNRQVGRTLTRHGRRLIGWDEILDGGLPPGATVMSWRGTDGGLVAARAGHDVVMSPTSHCYLDYAQAKGPAEPESIGGFIPLERVYGFEPVPPALSPTDAARILGLQGNLWSEFLREPGDVEYFAFPRAAALAEIGWSPAAPNGRDFDDFRRRWEVHRRRLDRWQVRYRPLDPR